MQYVEKLRAVTANLEKCERVKKYSTPDEDQAAVLAYSLLDIEEAAGKIINDHIPKLYLANLNADEVDDLVLEIGEELRHLLYHVYDTKVYDYLKEGNGNE